MNILSSEVLWAAISALVAVATAATPAIMYFRNKKRKTAKPPDIVLDPSNTGRNVDELQTEKEFIDSQVSAIGDAKSAVALCLRTVSASNANPRAWRINAALIGAKKKGVTVRVLAAQGKSQFPGAQELEEHDIDVCLNPELEHSDLRFLKVDDDLLVVGIAEKSPALATYTPSHSWALLKTAGLSDVLEREFLRLWVSPASRDIYMALFEYIKPFKRFNPEKLAADIGIPEELLRKFYQRQDLATVTGNCVFIFHGKACAGKSTLMRKLVQDLGGRRLDLLHFVLPLVFRYGNKNVTGERIKEMYGDVLVHLSTVPYDFIEIGADFPDFILPPLFEHLKEKMGRTPVLVHCCLPMPEACRRNKLRKRPVPDDVLEQQHADEELGVFRKICDSSGVEVLEIKTLAELEPTFETLTSSMKRVGAR